MLAEKTTFTPGEYAAYAQRYLHLNNVGDEASVTHRVIAIKQMAVGVADTTKAYSVKFNNKTAAINVALADDGVLLAINAPAQPQQLPARSSQLRSPLPRSPPVPERGDSGGRQLAKMAQLTAQEIYDIRENRSCSSRDRPTSCPTTASR